MTFGSCDCVTDYPFDLCLGDRCSLTRWWGCRMLRCALWLFLRVLAQYGFEIYEIRRFGARSSRHCLVSQYGRLIRSATLLQPRLQLEAVHCPLRPGLGQHARDV